MQGALLQSKAEEELCQISIFARENFSSGEITIDPAKPNFSFHSKTGIGRVGYPCPGVQMEICSTKKTDQDDDISVWCTFQEAPFGL